MESVMSVASQEHVREPGIGSTLSDVEDTAMDQIERASAKAGQVVESVAEGAREAGERVQEVVSTVDTTVRQALKDQPMVTLAVVAALGFVLGALWKTR
jgi:ElaB/YqjD/DUF883 family membrane-anchored ribosome-binding protein